MKKLLALVICILPLTGFAQKAPDNDAILKAIVDSQSPYYYPTLMLRYEMGDTTLTLNDYHHLYYGFAFQEEYKPLEPIEGEDQLLMLLERSEELSAQQASELVRLASVVMKADPFSPKNINFMAYAYEMTGDTLSALVNADRLKKILATIEATGTGMKENSPWHVLWFSHATDVVAAKGQEILRRQVRTRTVEYVMLTRKYGDVKGYFFDFGRVYWRKPDKPQREKRVQGFEVNGIPVGRGRSNTTPSR